MWAIASPSASRRLVWAWAAMAVVCSALMYVAPGQETVPFHFIWIGLAVVYGFTRWTRGAMLTALAFVTVVTGLILAHHAEAGYIGWEETTEEPLMASVFGAMVWHVNRRNLALAHVRRLADAERRRLEVQQRFVRLASHELRTPITVARGYTEMVRAAHQDATTIEDTEIVLDELDKLARITQRLVTLMQVEGPHEREMVDLDGELSRMVRRWEPTTDRKWLVRSSIGDALINPERLEAALDCLVENAIKFTRPGDRIELTGRRDNATWTVAVTDTGAGMAPETVAALLAAPQPNGSVPSGTVPSGTVPSGSQSGWSLPAWSLGGTSPGSMSTASWPLGRTETGTGLGLAIVRAVVNALGGWVEIRSTPGVCTTVELTVPAPDLSAPDLSLLSEFAHHGKVGAGRSARTP